MKLILLFIHAESLLDDQIIKTRLRRTEVKNLPLIFFANT